MKLWLNVFLFFVALTGIVAEVLAGFDILIK